MKKNFYIFGVTFQLIPFCIFLLFMICLVSLGNWQLARLKEKEIFISKINFNIQNPPVKINELEEGLKSYSKIELTGKFLDDQNIFLYGRRSAYPEKDGYYFLSKFKDDLGNIYLVSRGWVQRSAKKNTESFSSQDKEKIIAFVMPSEKKQFFVPENDIKNNVWFTLDLKGKRETLGLTEDNFYLMQVSSTNLPQGTIPLTSTYLNVVKNDHLEYAITWYSLAFLLFIMFFLYNKKKPNKF